MSAAAVPATAGVLEGVASSNVARGCLGLVVIAVAALAASLCAHSPPTRTQRFRRYVAHFHRRAALWSGAEEAVPRSRTMRVLLRVAADHSLLRLCFSSSRRERSESSRLQFLVTQNDSK